VERKRGERQQRQQHPILLLRVGGDGELHTARENQGRSLSGLVIERSGERRKVGGLDGSDLGLGSYLLLMRSVYGGRRARNWAS
jgi:hypothetical protein